LYRRDEQDAEPEPWPRADGRASTVPYNGSIVSTHDRLGDALDRALADARARLEPDLRAVTHEVSEAVRATLSSATEEFDRAGSLGAVLRALVAAAGRHAERVGLFLVNDGRVRPWQLSGIDETTIWAGDTNRATAFPVAIGGEVVAILYADAPASRAALEVLTRYAGRVLESKTLHMTLGIPAR
jgi:hypothetical protein